ncbi:MAG: type II secretion system protein GspE, partial [Planctomycetota bacterium]|nr:type II secretion system protein GspE [Planctomycetota bacterium]
ASSLEGVLAQRLVRLVCQNCREDFEPSEEKDLLAEWNVDVPETLYRGKGCPECQGTGFRGRSGVFELMLMTEEIRSIVLRHAAAGEVRKLALSEGMKSLHKDGWRLVLEGRTTVEELLRETKDEPKNGNSAN